MLIIGPAPICNPVREILPIPSHGKKKEIKATTAPIMAMIRPDNFDVLPGGAAVAD
jgi:copper homeostasis protein CutC